VKNKSLGTRTQQFRQWVINRFWFAMGYIRKAASEAAFSLLNKWLGDEGSNLG